MAENKETPRKPPRRGRSLVWERAISDWYAKHEEVTVMVLQDGGTLGPLTQKMFNFAWTKLLFIKGSQLYVPDIIKNGDPNRGLASYDPYVISGATSPVEVNVPQGTQDTACMSLQYPIPPVGMENPTLVFENLQIVNLHAVQPNGDLSFPPGYQVEANINLGTLEGQAMPLTIQSISSGDGGEKPLNYIFTQKCCVPKTPPKQGEKPECEKTFQNQGHGQFSAKVSKLTGKIVVTIDTNTLTVSEVNELRITFDSKDVTFDFHVEESGGPIGKEAMEEMVRLTIQTGIASGEVQNGIDSLVGSEDVKNHLKTLINEAIKEALNSPDVIAPASAKD
jgi:hypothetical protein